ncbi:rCG44871 [Rattus norvegicus]|uniref:RCG44871 n=1 Tax=Rattus norvegicus TaxID=10116 RepID=A6I4S2_RAT|nr:rCG44871 [Rattus norvegicus]
MLSDLGGKREALCMKPRLNRGRPLPLGQVLRTKAAMLF